VSGSVLFNLLFLVASLVLTAVLCVLVGRFLPSEHAFRRWFDRRLERMGFVEFARFLGLFVLAVVVTALAVHYS
jgi:hypothetical protein